MATITARPGHDAPPALPIVLARERGGWKIDMGASINRLMGVDLGDLMKQMTEGLGDLMAKSLGAIGEGLTEALSPGADAASSQGPPAESGDAAGSGGRKRRKKGRP